MLAVLLVTLLLAGCGSTTQYGDPVEEETVNTDFGSSDLQRIASKMVDDLLVFPPIIALTENHRPIMFIDSIRNKTLEHIDLESVTDTIQSKLINTGKFRFVDMQAVEQVRKQLEFQQEGGLVDARTAVSMGRQLGAQYMMYGNMSSIVKQEKKTKDVYYKFTLKLMNLESGVLEWSSEKEIRKQKNRAWIGI